MSEINESPEFWETAFDEKKEMWGFEPAKSTLLAKDFFLRREAKHILIPGIGYGRNGKLFADHGMAVTGIEISKTAIEMARKHYGESMIIHHGSVTEMPFDLVKYDGIFCYGLIHLLDQQEREKLIGDCYNQLEENGSMIFTAISKSAPTYKQGKFISDDRYEIFDGVKMYFYDVTTIQKEFGKAGLFEITTIQESQPFYIIKCKKKEFPVHQGVVPYT